jgi:undecaprenyl-diphosphatase
VSVLDAIFLGLIQGLTEFLPVSSSGHLVISEALLGIKQPGVSFEVAVHLGTLLSVVVFFRSRLAGYVRALFDSSKKTERREIGYLIVGTIPAGAIGLLFKDFFESAFSNPLLTAIMLLVTGSILLLPKLVKEKHADLSLPVVIIMGFGQALAILPGISRSGSTIAFGMLGRLKPAIAAEFSFLLAIPAIAGAAVLNADSFRALPEGEVMPYIVGTSTAFVFGLIAVYLVLAAVRRGRFEYFAYYCFAAGLLGIYLFF